MGSDCNCMQVIHCVDFSMCHLEPHCPPVVLESVFSVTVIVIPPVVLESVCSVTVTVLPPCGVRVSL